MSGIFGYFDPAGELHPDTASRMAEALAVTPGCRMAVHHAGAACIGVVDKGIWAHAGEILSNPDDGRVAVMQGEIVALKADDSSDGLPDTRKLLFGRMDAQALSAANGTFCAAILDPHEDRIDLLSDRYGTFLIYYAKCGTATLFAGQAKAVLATMDSKPKMDADAASLMLTIGEVAGEVTLFSGVQTLPSGSVARLDGKGLTIRKYWRYAFIADPSLTFTGAAERCGALLRKGVERRCRPDRVTGVPLSGGLDSRCILAMTPDPTQVPSYTWGLPGCRDLRYAAQIAATLGSPHHELMDDPGATERLAAQGVWLTEGLCDITDMHALAYPKLIGQDCPVILDGCAGDTFFGGNFMKRSWWHARSSGEAAAALWDWRATIMPDEVGELLLGANAYCDLVARARNAFTDCFRSYPGENEMDRAMAFLSDNRTRRFTSGGTHLFRSRVEVHMPFLDNDFFDFVCRVPHAWRFRHRLFVEMIRRCLPSMAAIRSQRTGLPAGTRWPLRFVSAALHRGNSWAVAHLHLPDVFASRSFSDFAGWFRGPLRPFVERVLLSGSFDERGLVRPDGLRRVLQRHWRGQDCSRLIGVLLSLELSCRLFFDDLRGATATFSNRCTAPAAATDRQQPVPEPT